MKYRLAVIIFFSGFLIIGMNIVKDYGVSWDEQTSRITGIISAKYIAHGDKTLNTFVWKYNGPVFEILLVAIEGQFHLTKNLKDVYIMRHIVTFLLFYVSVFFFYLLCENKFGRWEIGLLGCLFLIITPRIFADAFYNTKDIACLSLFIISMYTMVRYLSDKSYWNASWHALTCSLLIDVRVLGVFVPILTIVFLITDSLSALAKVAPVI